jgi:transcriptional regulator with XRE-family HTH domain
MGRYEQEREAMRSRFGKNLRALREARFPSQEAFALAAKLDRAHVYLLEHGQREPELSTLLILSEVLKVSIDRLTEGARAPKTRRSDRGKS